MPEVYRLVKVTTEVCLAQTNMPLILCLKLKNSSSFHVLKMPDWSDWYHNYSCYIRLCAVHQGLGRHVTIDKFVRMHSEKYLDNLMSSMSQKTWNYVSQPI